MGKLSWLVDPSDEKLQELKNWVRQGNDRYLAVRSYFLIHVDDATVLDGPVIEDVDLPVGTKRSIETTVSFSTTTVEEIQDSVADTVSEKVSSELIAGLSAKAGATAIASALELAGNLSAKSVSEVARSVGRNLVRRYTKSSQESEQVVKSEEFTVPQSSNKGRLTTRTFAYLKYRRVVVRIFLVCTESLLLQYKRNWHWKRIRETVKLGTDDVRKPLLKITFYRPMRQLSYRFDSFDGQLSDPGAIRVERLADPCPPRNPQFETPLQDLAQVAFPVNRAEDAVQRQRRVATVKKVAAKKAPAKRVAKKAVARKAPAKKVAAKKVAKKAVARKVASKR